MLSNIKKMIKKKFDMSPLNGEEEKAFKFFKDVSKSTPSLKLSLTTSPTGEKGICLKKEYKIVSNIFSTGDNARTELVFKYMLGEIEKTPIDAIEK